MKETITLSATQSIAGLDIRYRFNHGDGSLDPNAISLAQYLYPGSYVVSLDWFFGGLVGTVQCGTVNVSGSSTPTLTQAQVVNLAEFLGLGREQAVAQAANRGFAIIRLTREDSTRYSVTNDYRLDRLNIELDNGRVSSASVG